MAKQTFTTGQVLTAAQMTSLQQTAMGGGSTTAKTTSYVLVAADAGTTVAMNAAGSTTITVNTGLFSAGDSVFIQNWGAGTTTVTAGTATVTTHGSLALSQWEGGQLYFTSASAAIFFDISQSTGMTNPMTTTGDTIYSSSGSTPARLGIGSTGQILTVTGGVPVWATPAGGGGMTLLSTTTLSGATTTISSIDQTYTNLFAIITSMTNNTADGAFRVALNGTTNSHDGVVSRFEQGGSATLSGFANNYIITPSNLARANGTNTFVLLIPGYSNTANAVWKTFNMFGRYTSSTASTPISISGMYGDTAAITSLAFSNSGGNLAGGTVLLYGVK